MLDLIITGGHVLAWLLIIIPLIATVIIALLSVAALRPLGVHPQPAQSKKLAAIVPAHNESLLIEQTVAKLLAQDYPADSFCVLVIADNCSDDTADLARKAGARVLERQGNPGKGQALKDGLDLLLQEDWQGFVIVDADSHLDCNALAAINRLLSDGGDAFQLRYGVLNPTESIRTRLFELSMSSFNALRPHGKTNLGISAGLYGNGFGFTREVAEAVPYLAHSITEDVEYHVLLLQAGYKITFINEASVMAQMPATAADAVVQRERWERGRMEVFSLHFDKLKAMVRAGNSLGWHGMLEILMPPTSMIVLPTVLAMAVGSTVVRWLGLFVFILIILHYVQAAWRYGSLVGLLRVAAYVPWYLVWKTWVVARSLVKERNLSWNRTERH